MTRPRAVPTPGGRSRIGEEEFEEGKAGALADHGVVLRDRWGSEAPRPHPLQLV